MPVRVRQPAGRVYSSEPNVHQRRFRTVQKSVRRSTPSTTPRTLLAQNTLTQLDFVLDTDKSGEEAIENDLNLEDYAEEQSRPRKRRRRSGIGPSQQTLTQIHFFDDGMWGNDQDRENQESRAEDDLEDSDSVIPDSTSERDNSDEEDGLEFGKENVDPYSSQGNILKQKKSMHCEEGNGESSKATQMDAPQGNRASSTPSKPMKNKIPSSQSPESDSLSTSSRSTVSKSPRSPLQELSLRHTPSLDATISPLNWGKSVSRNVNRQSYFRLSPQRNALGSPSKRLQTGVCSQASTPNVSPSSRQDSTVSNSVEHPALLPLETSTEVSKRTQPPTGSQDDEAASPTSPPFDMSCPLSFVTPSSQPHVGNGSGRKRRLRSLTPMSPLRDTGDVARTSQLMRDESDFFM